MGYIKEPDGIDFVVENIPLTKEEQEAISKFIREDKAKKQKALKSILKSDSKSKRRLAA